MRRLLVGVFLTTGAAAFALEPGARLLLELEGRWTGTRAEVVWTTQMEDGVAAYRVARVTPDGAVALNAEWVDANLWHTGGSVYRVVDPDRRHLDQAAYRVDVMLEDGRVRTLGEWTVRFEDAEEEPAAPTATGADCPSGLVVESAEADLLTGPAVKVPVGTADMYAVAYAEIDRVLDLADGTAAGLAAAGQLTVRCGDQAVAYWPDADQQRLIFYGWPAETPYARTNFFLIEPGTGLHMPRIEPEPQAADTAQSFQSTRRYREDGFLNIDFFDHMPDDFYFWTTFRGPSGGVHLSERRFPIRLPGYVGGPVEVTVNLYGFNNTQTHVADVYFNDEPIGVAAMPGKVEITETFIYSPGPGFDPGAENEVRIVARTTSPATLFVMRYFEVTYERYYSPDQDGLQADAGGHARLGADRFDDAVVFEVTDRHLPRRVADAAGVIAPDTSWTASPASRWVLRERADIVPAAVQPGRFGSWMRADGNAVDYLVISSRELAIPAQSLADHRQALGLRTAVAFFEDICDEFASGVRTPEAIRELLRHAHDHWDAAPWMVVLAGWGHNDYLNVMTSATNLLPAMLAFDSAALRPADGLLADLNGDGVPELSIGRIPAQTAEQLSAYLAKLQAYENTGPRPEHVEAFFAADNADAGGDFAATNQRLAADTVARYAASHAILDPEDPSSLAEVRAAIQSAIADGAGIVHYTGHGAYQQLAAENILNVNNVAGMNNPPSPLLLSLTCLINRFDIPGTRSLGETLVLREGGGVLAVFAPSGLSWNIHAEAFAAEFYRLHVEDSADALGPALFRTRRSFGEISGIQAASLRTYNLLGDPALKLQGGAGGEPPGWVPTFAQWRWERLAYDELAEDDGDLDGELFTAYASGGLAEGLVLTSLCSRGGSEAVVQWNRRSEATDLEYRVWTCTDLVVGDWIPRPDIEILESGVSVGALERVEAALPMESNALFIKIQVFRK